MARKGKSIAEITAQKNRLSKMMDSRDSNGNFRYYRGGTLTQHGVELFNRFNNKVDGSGFYTGEKGTYRIYRDRAKAYLTSKYGITDEQFRTDIQKCKDERVPNDILMGKRSANFSQTKHAIYARKRRAQGLNGG